MVPMAGSSFGPLAQPKAHAGLGFSLGTPRNPSARRVSEGHLTTSTLEPPVMTCRPLVAPHCVRDRCGATGGRPLSPPLPRGVVSLTDASWKVADVVAGVTTV